MVADQSDDGPGPDESPETVVVRRGSGWRRIAATVGLTLLLLLLIAVAGVWIARRPIASNILEREFERRGVQATYELERVGLRTQVVRNLVIGDPRDPDLSARYALIQLRIKWDGSVEIYRVVARGVRLEGRLVNGRITWGQLDQMLPPPSGRPFRFPDMTIDVADATISLQTPVGPLGVAVQGSGNLTGGFRGRMVASSPGLDYGACKLQRMNASVAIEIIARRPHVEGPFLAERFACPPSNFLMDAPRIELDSRFNEGFDGFNGSGRITARRIIAGANGLANFVGRASFAGTPTEVRGEVDLAGRQSRLGPIFAERTEVEGRYRINAEEGTFMMAGGYSAEDASFAETALGGVLDPLRGLADTPIGPITTAIANAIGRNARAFDASGEIRIVNAPAGGAARISSADVRTDAGGRVRVAGGDGLTYYWWSGRIRLDGRVQMAGGGLPTAEILLRQRPNGATTGVVRLEPYSVGDSRLALAPLRFEATPAGATEFSTTVQFSGSFANGRVERLTLPISGRIRPDGGFAIGRDCLVGRVDALRFRDLRLGPTRLPVCPEGQEAIISQTAEGRLRVGARIDQPELAGRLGESPIRVAADTARITDGRDFALVNAAMRLGNPDAPVIVEAAGLQGTFRGSGISGTLTGGEAIIGNVPLLISDSDASWRFHRGDLSIEDELTLSDRAEEPRFYPLRSDDFRFVLSGDDIRATGTLRHPDSGIRVTDVSITHDLETGVGQALLDVPGITFGEALQPEELTRLTEGVVALVQGTVRGQGRINWGGEGEVTSTGEFSTVGMDLAAPFGPVEGLTTTIRFTDLLGLETAPGQTAAVASINPGILVENGVINYQLLPEQRVRVERGEWPFMGGRLILHETILNFARPTPKRLTFEVVGFDAKTFIDSLGFEGIEITGTFDGVLPMIFDDEGGRLVGGRLESRPPGGEFSYTGTEPDAGLMVGAAFDLLSHLRYQVMIIRLDGDLAGEFATRVTIDEVSLGDRGGFVAGLVRNAFRNVPLRVNLNISGPFRALIQMARGFEDPTDVIEPVMPFPLDTPGIVTETRNVTKEEDQTRTTPLDEVEVSPQPPKPSE